MEKPCIHYNQIDANVLSVISRESNAEQWIYNNFIQIAVLPNGHWGAFMFGNDTLQDCPFLKNRHHERSDIQINIIEFLKQEIMNSRYIWLNVRKKYLSVYKEKSEKNHDIFVYGFNDEQQIFYVADFFEKGVYSQQKVSYSEFFEGYNNVIEKSDTLGIYTIWLNKEYRYDVESCNTIKCGILDYLSEEYPFNKYIYMQEKRLRTYKYGTKIYDVLEKYCDNILNKIDRGKNFRVFDLLYQHKKLMTNRIYFLTENSINLKEYLPLCRDIEENAFAIRNSFLKFTLTGDINILLKMKANLNKIKEMEKEVLMDIVSTIGI